MLYAEFKKLCLEETDEAVTSLSTPKYMAQPIVDKCHHVHNRIFIQGFPNTTTLKEVSNMFQNYGKIIDKNIVKPSGYRWCYGFVTFHPDATDAVDCILWEMSNGKVFMMKGKTLKVSRALFKPKKFIPPQRNRSSISQDKPLLPLPPTVGGGSKNKKRNGSRYSNNPTDGRNNMQRNDTEFCLSCCNMGLSSSQGHSSFPSGNWVGMPAVYHMGGSTSSVDTVYPVCNQGSVVASRLDVNHPAFWGYIGGARPSVYRYEAPHHY